MLVRAGERGVNLNGCTKGFNLVRPSRSCTDRRHVFGSADSLYGKLSCHLTKNLVGFRMLRQGNQCAVPPQNSGLFARNSRYGRAEPFGVVERNIGNNGQERIANVGGVETATHADFEHSSIDARFSKVHQPLRGEDFEEAGHLRQRAIEQQSLGRTMDEEVKSRKVVVVNFYGAKPDALVGARQMRRSIEPDALPGSGKDGSQSSSRRAFTVGSGDEH